jgi:hypothetical protein
MSTPTHFEYYNRRMTPGSGRKLLLGKRLRGRQTPEFLVFHLLIGFFWGKRLAFLIGNMLGSSTSYDGEDTLAQNFGEG